MNRNPMASRRREKLSSKAQRLALLRGRRHAAAIDGDHAEARELDEEILRAERGSR